MIGIPGYRTVSRVYESSSSLVYRAVREVDGLCVVLKILRAEYPGPEELARCRQEYEITRSLDLEAVIRAYDIERCGNGLAMVLEDFGGDSLKILASAGTFSLEERIGIAIKIAEGLRQIHSAHIIHKDINPSNIVYNPQTGQLKVIDFGISTAPENPTAANPTVIEGALPYISPEQTGRMNRSLDYRSDFYSLGVTLYELIAGRLPFDACDPMELVHCHIAREPEPLHRIDPRVSEALSRIVMKLMQKAPEERYRSARGIKADLEIFLRLLETGREVEVFPVGRSDLSDQLLIPQKLYGREQEIDVLLAAMDRVFSAGRGHGCEAEVVILSGYSGIGKSSLVREIYRPLTRAGGRFISGKFDRHRRDIPYSALASAFQELVQSLLTESEQELARWRTKILDSLGPNVALIIEIIPDLELITGSQPDPVPLPPSESQNRFHIAFERFVDLFTLEDHPLVIFLDDLQWADRASLKLIELIINGPGRGNLLLIGTYRDNEVHGDHPLVFTLDQMRKAGARITPIFLSPLNIEDVSALLADTLDHSPEKTKALAELVLSRTGGNPFFIGEFLRSLAMEGLIVFDHGRGAWTWRLEEIQSLGVTANVVDLLKERIRKIEQGRQAILSLAAVIGHRFDLKRLSTISGKPPERLLAELRELMEAGLILPVRRGHRPGAPDGLPSEVCSTEYRFAHDCIRQTACELISEEHRQRVHLQVGRLLLQETATQERDQRILEITNHLNQAVVLIDTPPERRELAEWNLLAGRKAKASAAYGAALKYLKAGIGILEKDCWEGEQYGLSLDLHAEAAEAALLAAEYEEMEVLASVIRTRARNVLDKVKANEVRIGGQVARGRLTEAIDLALKTLGELGEKFPRNPSKWTVLTALLKVRFLLARKSTSQVLGLPPMMDPRALAAMRVLNVIGAALYRVSPVAFALVPLKMIQLSMRYGNAALSPPAYAMFGTAVARVLGEIDLGYRFGHLSIELLNRIDARQSSSKTIMLFTYFLQQWKEPARQGLQDLLKAHHIALETGDLEVAGLSATSLCGRMLYWGAPLVDTENEIVKHIRTVERLKQTPALRFFILHYQLLSNLAGRASDPCTLAGEHLNEKEMLPCLIESGDRFAVFLLFCYKLMLGCIFRNNSLAYESACSAEEYLDPMQPNVFLLYFYGSLARLGLFPEASRREQSRLMKSVAACQKKMKRWADHAPANFLHQYYLVEAERARVLGREPQAMKLYDRAMELAAENGYTHHEALANELAGEFHLSAGRLKSARAYLLDARHAYLRWGATAKVQEMTRRYSTVLSTGFEAEPTESPPVTIALSSGTESGALDLTSLMKASQTLSGEIEIDRLAAQLMQIVMENAGADKGFLIVKDGEQLTVRAGATAGVYRERWMESVPVEECPELSPAIVNYAARTAENVLLNNALHEGPFTEDAYVRNRKPQSILCLPILDKARVSGVLYLENRLTTKAFTPHRVNVLGMLASQAAISLENSRLFSDLRESEGRYRDLFENAVEGIFHATADDRLVAVNPSLARMAGFESPEEMILLVTDFAQQLYTNHEDREELRRILQRDRQVAGFEIEMCRKDHSRIWCSISAGIVEGERGEILGYKGSVIDITERMEKEKAEREKEAAKAAAQAKGEFLANMSHEIRTPMNAIIGLTDLALKTELTAQQRDYLEKVRASSRSLLGIVNGILDFSKIDAGKLSLEDAGFDLREVMSTLSQMLSGPAAEKGIELVVSIAQDVPHALVGDSLRLGQVLVNLASNAVKFTEKGEVAVRTTLVEKTAERARLFFSVKDTGIGIAPEKLPTLYDAFTQADGSTSRKYGGTGLGLTISKRLVEMMGGEIRAESSPGEGSTFSFTLDFALQKSEEKGPGFMTPKEAPSSAKGIEGARILLVEDNAINRQVAREILAGRSVIVEEAVNGREAVEMASRSAADGTKGYDAVLMDVQMPEIDGYEATRRIRGDDRLKGLPIIAMTAHAMKVDREKGIEAGMNDHITKPIEPEQLFSMLSKWIAPGQGEPSSGSAAASTHWTDMDLHHLPDEFAAIDLRSALRRVGGKRALLAKILHQFHSNYSDAHTRIAAAIGKGDAKTARLLAHTMKGLASNISAMELYSAASDVEAAVENDQAGERMDRILDVFERKLDLAVAAAVGIEQMMGMEVSAQQKIAPDLTLTGRLLMELEQSLRMGSFEAVELFESLKNHLDGSSFPAALHTAIEELEACIAAFDFDRGGTALYRIADSLGVRLGGERR